MSIGFFSIRIYPPHPRHPYSIVSLLLSKPIHVPSFFLYPRLSAPSASSAFHCFSFLIQVIHVPSLFLYPRLSAPSASSAFHCFSFLIQAYPCLIAFSLSAFIRPIRVIRVPLFLFSYPSLSMSHRFFSIRVYPRHPRSIVSLLLSKPIHVPSLFLFPRLSASSASSAFHS
jgi:hypothetical protein